MPNLRGLFMENSQERLVEMILRRTRAGADTAAIDRKIWDLFGEDWTVMFRNPREALACALDMQAACQRYSRDKAPEDKETCAWA